MTTQGAKRLVSIPLLAGGAVLLVLGARELIEPLIGQAAAARTFNRAAAAPPSVQPQPLRRGDEVGKLVFPRLGAAFYVVEGDQDDELRRGPGHLRGSAMPGESGNCIIAGHRDTHFRVLQDIRQGDDLLVETKSGQYLYRVQRTRVVSADNTGPLQPTTRAELNLITCFPFSYVGSAPKRFVVEALLAAKVSASAKPVVE
ncbi:MAG TPA: class D sortase [Candidatus Sulfopaludibacter sp.]|jgi:sortase A|nr:class D sortase [Candidatus Sulfopaludibacter sp.]